MALVPIDPPAAPYATSLEHLRAELERVGLLLRIAAARPKRRADGAGPSSSPFPEEALLTLLDRGEGLPPGTSQGSWSTEAPALAEARASAQRMAGDISRRCAESLRRGSPPRLAALVERLGLERLDAEVLLLSLLVELEREAARLLARFEPEGGGRLTVGAALDILAPTLEARLAARARLAPRAPLLRHELVRLQAPADGRGGLPSYTLEVDEHLTAWLQGEGGLDPRLRSHARLVEPRAALEELLLPEALKQGLVRFLTGHPVEGGSGSLVYLQGQAGTGRKTLAEALCRLLGLPLLTVDCAGLLVAGEEVFRAAVRLAAREARLHGAVPLWAGADTVLDEARPVARAALLEALAAHPGPGFLSGSAPWEPAGALGGHAFVRVELPRPSAVEQRQLWERALGDERAPEADLASLTSTFRLTGGQIREAAHAARALARFRGGERLITLADLTAACRLRHGRKLATLSRRIPPRHGWEDLVLPADRKTALRELCLQLKHRGRVMGDWGFERKLGPGRPLAALFSGPPGTGKTLAAAVIAAELGVELYHIDLSRVVSKYIGETEKHLSELFAEAEAANAALFFDEADALLGKRTEVRDSHDRYANLETSYLLQRIDTYEGVIILASNLVKNIDEAFVRRIGFVVEFPMPGPVERLRIWQGLWPKETPLGPDVDLGFLSERVELSGGYLRNIALAAAFLAAEEGGPVGMRHLLHAARREYQKMGKMVDAGRLLYPPAR